MKQINNFKSMRAIFAMLCVMFVCITASAQKFETHKVIMAEDGIDTKSVKIKSASTFSIKKDNRVKWVSFETDDESVTIKTTANTTNKRRSCNLVLLDENGNAVDKLIVEQNVKISTSAVNNASRLAGNATRTSSLKSTSQPAKKTTKASSSKRVSGGQCAARTKQGTRCSRKAAAGSNYCWQHNR